MPPPKSTIASTDLPSSKSPSISKERTQPSKWELLDSDQKVAELLGSEDIQKLAEKLKQLLENRLKKDDLRDHIHQRGFLDLGRLFNDMATDPVFIDLLKQAIPTSAQFTVNEPTQISEFIIGMVFARLLHSLAHDAEFLLKINELVKQQLPNIPEIAPRNIFYASALLIDLHTSYLDHNQQINCRVIFGFVNALVSDSAEPEIQGHFADAFEQAKALHLHVIAAARQELDATNSCLTSIIATIQTEIDALCKGKKLFLRKETPQQAEFRKSMTDKLYAIKGELIQMKAKLTNVSLFNPQLFNQARIEKIKDVRASIQLATDASPDNETIKNIKQQFEEFAKPIDANMPLMYRESKQRRGLD